MGLINCGGSFEFEQNLAIGEQVCAEVPNLLSTEPDAHWDLALYFYPSATQVDRQGLLVHTFEKAVTTLIVNIVKHADDLLGEFAMLQILGT